MSLHSKLAEVMGEVTRIPKNGYNDFHKYAYVTETDLVEAVRDKLATRQVMLYPSVEEVSREGTITTVRVKFTAADGESGETFEFWGAGCGDDKSDKGVYKALTGCLKYALMKLFLVATGDDPEATDRSAAGKRDAESTSGGRPSGGGKPVAPSRSGGKSSLPPSKDETVGATSQLSTTPSSDAGLREAFGEGASTSPASGTCAHEWIAAPRAGFQACKKCGLGRKGSG